MNTNTLRKYDKHLGLVFLVFTILFVVLAMTNTTFFEWAFERHKNQLSWYIRPLFIIPFCYFAYKRSWTGVMGSMFAVMTSMFWFPIPESVSPLVVEFLEMEKEYLMGNWDFAKILITLMVPVSLTALAAAFWKRNLFFGMAVMVFIALAKISWSVVFGGESGTSVMVPAMVGLLVCAVLIYVGFRRMESRKKTS